MQLRRFNVFWVHKYSIHFYNWTDLIMLLYTFLVTCFNCCIISFNKLSELLPAFTCARAIGNLCSICLGVRILSCSSFSCFSCYIFFLRHYWRIIIMKFNSFISCFVDYFNIVQSVFLHFWSMFFICFFYFSKIRFKFFLIIFYNCKILSIISRALSNLSSFTSVLLPLYLYIKSSILIFYLNPLCFQAFYLQVH